MKYLLATTNKAKIRYYGTKLKEYGIEIVTLPELAIDCDVEETGNNSLDNAVIKASVYHKLSGMPTIALDDGLFLENVPDEMQPGTNVRRIKGRRLSDKEMLEHYIGLVNDYGNNGILNGYFLKGVAIVFENNTYKFEQKFNRCFVNKQSEVINEGYPLASMQIIPSLNKFKSELTALEEKKTTDIEQKDIFAFILNVISTIERNSPKRVLK